MPTKPECLEAGKPPLKRNPSATIQPVGTKNRCSQLETEENPTDNKNITTDSLNKKITASQNAINKANQNVQNSSIKLKEMHRTKGSSQLPSHLLTLWFKGILWTLKAGKCQAVIARLWWNISEVKKLRTGNPTSIQQSNKNLKILSHTQEQTI